MTIEKLYDYVKEDATIEEPQELKDLYSELDQAMEKAAKDDDAGYLIGLEAEVIRKCGEYHFKQGFQSAVDLLLNKGVDA